MKHFHIANRLTVLLTAVALLVSLAACGEKSTAPDAAASSAPVVTAAELPAFINPLPDVELQTMAKTVPPTADLLQKINTAYNQNSDVIGWLSVPNTDINEYVLQTTDNKYYERKDITKGYNWYGCYWADYEGKFGDRNSISKNTIIYGHSMDDKPDGDRFSQLKKYADIDFLQANPYIYFSTPEDNMVWEVFAVVYTDLDFKTYVHPNIKNSELMKVVAEARDRSKFDIDVDVNPNDKILTLSTCTYPSENKEIYEQARYVIFARLVRPGETMKLALKATVNQDMRQPVYK